MSETDDSFDMNPETLIAVPNDLEAAMIVSALAAHDIDATTAGEYTSGFRAEAPGLVSVLVRQRDLPRANDVLDKLSAERPPAAEHSGPTHSTSRGFSGKQLIVPGMWLMLGFVLLRMLFLVFGS